MHLKVAAVLRSARARSRSQARPQRRPSTEKLPLCSGSCLLEKVLLGTLFTSWMPAFASMTGFLSAFIGGQKCSSVALIDLDFRDFHDLRILRDFAPDVLAELVLRAADRFEAAFDQRLA